ncbi:glycosyltransferase family 2 protein [Hymenobacter busanensis]|uniref:Glycosyltransferase family 2 protein n=1 Tax=Hymenobacter busanensis TaxID=2607656 RepID=A0A7L4ZUV6_9BACT|nr:glycosyltransferase family 2 protein [Hymenobacter busanensis]KAA9339257.1 glycosyltransferase family 2 protein [Hymenobacter busanensis]QHJ06981.1 glycosyltransferase [Hymenobacter busanensis]
MLHIVIPVFNRWAFTRECLLSLRRQTNRNFRVVVVDDGSTDGTAEALAREFPEVTVLHGTGFLFWTAGVNLGIRHALRHGADRVMTLNNDVQAAPDFIEQMLKAAAKHPRALLGALELDADTHAPVYGGEQFSFLTHRPRHLLHVLPPEQRRGLHPVTYLPGRGLLIPATALAHVGLFDEKRLPHYLADYDYTSVARRRGFPVFINYEARLLTYPDESGQEQTRRRRSLRGYYEHLFGIRGGGNLRNFTHFALKNCPAPLVPLFLLNGYARRMVGYFLH